MSFDISWHIFQVLYIAAETVISRQFGAINIRTNNARIRQYLDGKIFFERSIGEMIFCRL